MKFLQKTIPIIFGIILTYILILLFFFSNMNYAGKIKYMFPNIIAIIFIGIIFFIYYKHKDKKDISDKKYNIILFSICLITFIIQLFIIRCCFFHTGWDAELIEYVVKYFTSNNELPDYVYMTRYPNNLMITFILTLIMKLPIPFIGRRFTILLVVNALLVNLAGAYCSKSIRNITGNNRLALSSLFITIPLIMLSPWILIVYTDTFAILLPILMIYLYTKEKRKMIDFFLIIFMGFFGMFIKPTIIITLMAIFIVELFSKSIFTKNIKTFLKYLLVSAIAILIALLINFESKQYLKFKPADGVYEFTMVHFLAMGQNDKSDGVFNDQDYEYSVKNGMKGNLDKFKRRITNRTFTEQIHFFSRKTLVNYNSGSFSWAREGTFYRIILPPKDSISKILRQYYYTEGKYNKYFLQLVQFIWLFVLFFVPFIIKNKNNKNELVLMTSIIGITLFLTIFEARGRYLYCYSPIFVSTAILGIYHLKQVLIDRKKSKKQKH